MREIVEVFFETYPNPSHFRRKGWRQAALYSVLGNFTEPPPAAGDVLFRFDIKGR